MFHSISNHRLLKRVVKAFFIYGFSFLLNIILGSLFLLEALGNTFGLDLETCGGFLICIFPQPTFLGWLTLIVLSVLTGLWFQDFIRCIKQRKILRVFILLGVVVFSVGGFIIARPFIHDTLANLRMERRLQDAEYYNSEYLEIGEPTSSQQFIYARGNRIMVSEMDGTNARVIKEVALDATKKIFSVSPKGTYYIAMSKNGDEVYNSGIQKDAVPIAEVRAVSDNAFVMSITSQELRQDELKLCKWSFDEQFLACQYVGGTSKRDQLVLFNTADRATERVYDDPSWGDTWRNFSWSDENLDFFYDQDGKIYHIDNIREMSKSGFTIPSHRVALQYSAPCFGAGAYQNNTIYCVTTTKELHGYKALPKNEFLSIKDGLIIAYRIDEENVPQNPIVVTKAPFSFSAGFDDIALYPVNANYIAVYGADYGFFLLNLQTGKINPFQTFTIRADDLVWTEYIETSNIFNNTSLGTVPVSYKGDL